MKKKDVVYPSDEQMIALYNMIYGLTHKDSFKVAEMRDLLFDDEYFFSYERPKPGWYDTTVAYLTEQGYDISNFNIKPSIMEHYYAQLKESNGS